MRYAGLVVTLAVAATIAAATPPQQVPRRKIPCKTPENAPLCYWTRGRLAIYNGWPPWRIWRVGTTRILAIYSGPSTWNVPKKRMGDAANPELPATLMTAYERGAKSAIPHRVFADFEICPLDEDLPGVMQHACIESAKNIFVTQFE